MTESKESNHVVSIVDIISAAATTTTTPQPLKYWQCDRRDGKMKIECHHSAFKNIDREPVYSEE